MTAPKIAISSIDVTITGPFGQTKETAPTAPSARLVVNLVGSDTWAAAHLISTFKPDRRSIYLVARGAFSQLSDSVGEIGGSLVGSDIAKPSEQTGLAIILSKWKAELIIAYFCADDGEALRVLTASREMLPKWWQLSRSDNNEDYVHLSSLTNPVAVYSQTRASVELVGKATTIVEGFDALRVHM